MPLENGELNITYEFTEQTHRKLWLEMFRKNLPTIFAFWGTALLLVIIGLALSWNSDRWFPPFLLVLFLVILVAASMVASSYNTYMRYAKKAFAGMSPRQKVVSMRFSDSADFFEIETGLDYCRLSWEAVSGFKELDNYILLNRSEQLIYIPKAAFADESEVNFLRNLLAYRLEKPQFSLDQ